MALYESYKANIRELARYLQLMNQRRIDYLEFRLIAIA